MSKCRGCGRQAQWLNISGHFPLCDCCAIYRASERATYCEICQDWTMDDCDCVEVKA